MAYTKIKAVKHHLQRCLDYTANPKKTEQISDLQKALDYAQDGDKTAHQLFVAGINCDPANAHETMCCTKHRWNKDQPGHVQAYHVIQSFAPGEATPEQAHEIGCEFARRAFGKRYEATVSTHLDKGHLHNHIVFNSVSFVDGRMFRNDFKGYFKGIRSMSDQVCREHHLSIIDPQQKGKAYAEWQSEKQGQPTVRGMIRADVDKALELAVSWETFVAGLRKMGYSVKYGRNVKYAAIRHKTGSRNIRLKSLGNGYDEASLRDLLARKARGETVTLPSEAAAKADASGKEDARQFSLHLPASEQHRRGRFHGRFPILPHQKITGFMALYYRYVHLLGRTRQRRASRRCYFLLREDFRQFDRYLEQFDFVWTHHIQTLEELAAVKQQANVMWADLDKQRAQLYRQRGNAKKHGAESRVAELSAEIAALSAQIRVYRREVMLCGWIEENALHLREQLAETERAERHDQEPEKTKKKGGFER